MKKLMLLIILLIIGGRMNAQYLQQNPSPAEPKENYEYIIIYRTIDDTWKSSGGAMYVGREWITHIRGFHNWQDLMNWLNSSNWVGGREKRVRITNDELIAIYDLETARKIKLELKVEDKVEPKKVEIQEEKWTDMEWIKK